MEIRVQTLFVLLNNVVLLFGWEFLYFNNDWLFAKWWNTEWWLWSRVERIHYSLGGAGLGHTLVSCVYRYTDLVGCVLVPVAVGRGGHWPASSSLRGQSPQALTLLGGARFITWRLGCPFLGGMPKGPEAFLEPLGVSGLWPCDRTYLKRALCHTRPVGETCDKNQLWCFKLNGIFEIWFSVKIMTVWGEMLFYKYWFIAIHLFDSVYQIIWNNVKWTCNISGYVCSLYIPRRSLRARAHALKHSNLYVYIYV